MKSTINTFCLLALLCAVTLSSFAQGTRKERQAKKAAEVKALVDANDYVFKAQSANPSHGSNFNLTGGYDVSVSKDTLKAYLPYYGMSFQAATDADGGGIHFTTTNFTSTKIEKKGSWEITMKTADANGVEKMYLSIADDGFALLRITSTNRDAISYDGYIEARKKEQP